MHPWSMTTLSIMLPSVSIITSNVIDIIQKLFFSNQKGDSELVVLISDQVDDI